MPAPKSKTLSLLFRAAARKTTSPAKKVATKKAATKSLVRSTTNSSKLVIPSILSISNVRLSAPSKASSSSPADDSDSAPSVQSLTTLCDNVFAKKQTSPHCSMMNAMIASHLSPSASQRVRDEHVEDLGEHVNDSNLLKEVSSTINDFSDSPVGKESDSEDASNVSAESMLSILPTYMPEPGYHVHVSQHNKEVSRERKKKWIYKSTHNVKFNKLIQSCAARIGSALAITAFEKLGRETGEKEYKSLIGICIDSAKKSEDEEALLEQIYKAHEIFKSMKEHGFEILEDTYGPFLMFLIDMRMVDEFFYFLGIIKDESSTSNARLGYYEMLLAIEINDDTKIQELSNEIASCDSQSTLQEHYLMALCDGDRRKEVLEVLERIDVTQVSSEENLSIIFNTLGRLSLEHLAVKFISELKECDQRAKCISILISNYATSMENIEVEEALSKFRSMHEESGVLPSGLSYEKLIKFCCNSLEVREALDIANQMVAAGLTLSVETINYILHTCEDSGEFHLVHSIYSMLSRFSWKSNCDTYRSLINLSVRAKDIQGAFSMLEDLKKVNVRPTSSMYNAIIAGFYREKNVKGALQILEQMEAANVKPDSVTFAFHIANCNSEKDITEYYEKLISSGLPATKHVSMALINAYANCGQFEKAKQVFLDCEIDVKEELRSVLVSALASNGRISDALEVYEDMKLGGGSMQPKAIISLIEHLQSTEKLSTMLLLIDEFTDMTYWLDASCRVVGYCVRNKNLRVALDLLEEIINKFRDNVMIIESVINEVFSYLADMEPSDVQFGLDLLQALKDELLLHPTRRSLDFLLSACVTAKDPQSAGLIWEEYSAAGLPHNIFGFLRMYQIYMASGEQKSADDILKKIPLNDPHVCLVIRACRQTYTEISKNKKSKKKKKKLQNN